MTVTNIADDHHIVRHCKGRLYFIKDGKIHPYPAAFHLREATATQPAEDTLSGVYFEWFDGTSPERLQASCHYIKMEMKRKDALLVLNAGLIRQQGIDQENRLRVTHEPDAECPPYSTIRGLPKPPKDKLCSLLASLTLIDSIDFASAHG